MIGLGGQLPRLGPALTIVHATDGAPRDLRDAAANGFATREEYARARRRELAAALALAGIGLEQTRQAGLADQEVSFHIDELARFLTGLMNELKPAVVFTHPYEGGHPDHDATCLAVHAACRAAPALMEFTSYHAGASGISVCEFLPNGGCPVSTYALADEERERKRRMLECFVTQRATLKQFPVELERTRIAPRYDFTRPPHPGPLYYDRFDWGMRGERWLELARGALRRLGTL